MISGLLITAVILVAFVISLAVLLGIAAANESDEFPHVEQETSRRVDAIRELGKDK